LKEKIQRLEKENEELKKFGSHGDVVFEYENKLDDMKKLQEKIGKVFF
jgi:hypothetical protein